MFNTTSVADVLTADINTYVSICKHITCNITLHIYNRVNHATLWLYSSIIPQSYVCNVGVKCDASIKGTTKKVSK